MTSLNTTSFPLGLFCNATLSGPLPELKKRSLTPALDSSSVPIEPLTDEEIEELTHDLCSDEKST
jgi:hypothetical protein